MADKLRSGSRTTRLAVLGSTLGTSVVLGIAGVMAIGNAGTARGTSEAVGFYGAQSVANTPQTITLNISKSLAANVVLSTTPNIHLAYQLGFSGSKTTVSGTTQANSKGQATIKVAVASVPMTNGQVVGTLSLHVTDPGAQGAASVGINVLPPLRFGMQNRLTVQNGGSNLMLSITLPAKYQAAASVTKAGAKTAMATAHGLSDGTHPVVLDLKLGTLSGNVVTNAALTITSSSGGKSSLTFPVVVH